jgi:hypothetical protein
MRTIRTDGKKENRKDMERTRIILPVHIKCGHEPVARLSVYTNMAERIAVLRHQGSVSSSTGMDTQSIPGLSVLSNCRQCNKYFHNLGMRQCACLLYSQASLRTPRYKIILKKLQFSDVVKIFHAFRETNTMLLRHNAV